MSDLIRLLNAINAGERQASEALLPLVYNELRSIAASRLSQERPGQTLQATALVHEAWLRLAPPDGAGILQWDGRRHFLSAAAEAMRRILVEKARRKARVRHGGGMERVDVDEIQIQTGTRQDLFLEVDEALNELAAQDPRKAEVVKLRYFVGLPNAEIAEALGISVSTVERHWAFAKAWLFERISAPQTACEKIVGPGEGNQSQRAHQSD